MAQEAGSWLDKVKQLGSEFGIPKADVNRVIEAHRKNLDALDRSMQVAAEGAKSLADKQREIVEGALREAAAMTRDFKPTGDPKEMLAKQSEFAKKAFDSAIQNSRDVAELANQTTADVTAIIHDRLRESLKEFSVVQRHSGG